MHQEHTELRGLAEIQESMEPSGLLCKFQRADCGCERGHGAEDLSPICCGTCWGSGGERDKQRKLTLSYKGFLGLQSYNSHKFKYLSSKYYSFWNNLIFGEGIIHLKN